MSITARRAACALNKRMPPFAAGHDDLVLDVDFRLGQAAVEAILETAEGMTKIGTPSGVVYDSVRGLNPNGSFGWRTNAWTPSKYGNRASLYTKRGLTVYFEVERSALASTYVDELNGFIDNADGPSINDYSAYTVGITGYSRLFECQDPDAAPFAGLFSYYQMTWNGAFPVGRFVTRLIDTAADQMSMRFNRPVPSQLGDVARITIVLDANSNVHETYIDGHLKSRQPWDVATFGDDAAGTDIFKRLVVLVSYGGTGAFRGYIRRMQIIRGACRNRAFSGHVVAGIGDSQTERSGGGYGGNVPPDVASINAYQNGLSTAYSRIEAGPAGPPTITMGNPSAGYHVLPWMTGLANIAAFYGAPFKYFVAGRSGGTFGTNVNQIEQRYYDAVIAQNPHCIIMLGSVNDIAQETPTADLETQIKLKLDQLIDGCSRLKKIIFLTTPPTIGSNSAQTATKNALLVEHVAMQMTLSGYRNKVVALNLFEAMGGLNAPGMYFEGSHPVVGLWDAINAVADKSGQDIHVGQNGMAFIAQFVYPTLEQVLYL